MKRDLGTWLEVRLILGWATEDPSYFHSRSVSGGRKASNVPVTTHVLWLLKPHLHKPLLLELQIHKADCLPCVSLQEVLQIHHTQKESSSSHPSSLPAFPPCQEITLSFTPFPKLEPQEYWWFFTLLTFHVGSFELCLLFLQLNVSRDPSHGRISTATIMTGNAAIIISLGNCYSLLLDLLVHFSHCRVGRGRGCSVELTTVLYRNTMLILLQSCFPFCNGVTLMY
jgi:hypothetical protein